MITLRYIFDEENYDYDVDREEIKKELYRWMRDNYSIEELLDYIFDNDLCQIDILKDFLEEIHDLFEDDAEECFWNSKEIYNEYNQEDFI